MPGGDSCQQFLLAQFEQFFPLPKIGRRLRLVQILPGQASVIIRNSMWVAHHPNIPVLD